MTWSRDVQIRVMRRCELAEAAGVLARGMRDNPVHLRVFGPGQVRRLRRLTVLFTTMLQVMPLERWVAVDGDGVVVGVMAAARPGRCRPGIGRLWRLGWRLLRLGPATLLRVAVWRRGWRRHDPDAPHSHVGPLAVDAHLQGRGIGSQLLTVYLGVLDRRGHSAHLETDRMRNVVLYRRFGFEVTGSARVLGVTTWFLQREGR